MPLKATPLSKCLDKKLLIFGFEIPDLLAVFLLLSGLNFFFGSSGYTLFLVWAPPTLLALIIRFGKRGKADNYLIHLLRYKFTPGVYPAFQDSSFAKMPARKGIL